MLKLNPTARALFNPELLKTDASRLDNLVYNSPFGQAVVDTIGGLLTVNDIAGMKVKGRIHTIRTVRWMVAGDFFDRVSAFVAAVICDTSAKSIAYKDMHYAIGGKGDGTTSIPGVSRSKLIKVIGQPSTNMGTLSAQSSSSAGSGGLFCAMGIVEKINVHTFRVTKEGRNHPFLIAYALALNATSERDLITLFTDKKNGK